MPPPVLPFLSLLPKLVILINDEVDVMRMWTLHPFWTPPIGLEREREKSAAVSILLVRAAITIRWTGANYSLPLRASEAGAGTAPQHTGKVLTLCTVCSTQHNEERPRKVGLFYLEKTRLRGGGYLVGACRYLQQRLWTR